MTDKIAWYGTEVEGKYAGVMSVFIRGGYEDRFKDVLEAMAKAGISWKQLYLGAGSTPAPEENCLELLREYKEQLAGKTITIEIPIELYDNYEKLAKEDVHIMVTAVVKGSLPFDCTIKLRNEEHLFVSTKVSHLEIHQVYGSYDSDVVLF